MRELLNDLEESMDLGSPDPMRRVQETMRQHQPKRFYTSVTVAETSDGYCVLLDGRSLKSPSKSDLLLPTLALAELVAAEYDAQQENIIAETMPVTRLVHAALDGVAKDPQAIIDDILLYAGNDLMFYRAEAPQKLVEMQSQAWDPVLKLAESFLGGKFILTEGLMHVEQPEAPIAAYRAYLEQNDDPFRLAAMHLITTLTGSALLMLGTALGRLDPESAWSAAHIDEAWNEIQWGEDTEAVARLTARKRDMIAAIAVLNALPTS